MEKTFKDIKAGEDRLYFITKSGIEIIEFDIDNIDEDDFDHHVVFELSNNNMCLNTKMIIPKTDLDKTFFNYEGSVDFNTIPIVGYRENDGTFFVNATHALIHGIKLLSNRIESYRAEQQKQIITESVINVIAEYTKLVKKDLDN